MKIGIISGSVRKQSQSARIAQVLAEQLTQLNANCKTELFDLAALDIPLWSEDKWNPDSALAKLWQPVSEGLKSCDSFIVISPEWAGMVTPHLKNLLLMCDGFELAYKPALIVSVSSSVGGAYPVAELRMSGYKNNHIWWLPDQLIYRQVESRFTEQDEYMLPRTQSALRLLLASTEALKPVREQCIGDLAAHAYGM